MVCGGGQLIEMDKGGHFAVQISSSRQNTQFFLFREQRFC